MYHLPPFDCNCPPSDLKPYPRVQQTQPCGVPPGSWMAVFALSHWPRATWWSADRNNKTMSKSGAASFLNRFWPDLGPGWGWLGLGLSGVGLGLRPYLGPTRKCFLARKREQPTAPKIRAADLLGKLPRMIDSDAFKSRYSKPDCTSPPSGPNRPRAEFPVVASSFDRSCPKKGRNRKLTKLNKIFKGNHDDNWQTYLLLLTCEI